jgi:PIN domain nuclease of toxin-antitoxin system
LLDTHVLLWSALDPDRISGTCRDAIEDGENSVFVSAVSAWEIAIKQSIHKLELARPAERWLPDVLRRSGFAPLPVDITAALRVRALPWHHRDPFDRLLAAQAIEEGLTLVTNDEIFARYGLSMMRA